jgi:soluble lytic murein transglycosylase-like protein
MSQSVLNQAATHLVKQTIFTIAEECAPPTYMILAQAKIESGYNPDAYNASSGAMGLFQIKPTTARQPGFGVTPLTSIADLNDPEKATLFACEYLHGLYLDTDVGAGSWAKAILHYNVGPGADVNTASDAYKALAIMVSVLESEPYPLTQGIV